MKTISRLLILVGLVWTLYACQSDESLTEGKVTFNFSSVPAAVENGRVSEFIEFPPGAFLSVTLVSSGGTYQHTLSVMKMGSGYVSDPWAFPVGEYTITDFMVMNDEDEVLYATPKEGSTLATFVSDPLPVSFMVSADDVINLSMEVVSTLDYTPEDLGYVSFGIHVAPVPQFSVSVFIPGDDGFMLTDATAYLLHDADTLVSASLATGVNPIIFDGMGEETYTMVIIKQGYARYTKQFTLQYLADEYGNNPVQIMLEPAFTLSTPVTNSYFTLDLQGEAGMTLNVDWGDGTSNTFVFADDHLYHEHEYIMPGSKFISVTGDFDMIQRINLFYENGSVTDIHLNHLNDLKDFRMGLNATLPASIDFSDNLQLEYLDISYTQLPAPDISNNSRLSFLAIPLNEHISSAEIDQIILDILNHSTSENPPGFPRILDLGMITGYVALPSSTGMANIEILETEYGWEVY